METIKTVEDLRALPDRAILRHPKYDALVERYHRTPEQIMDPDKTYVPTHDCVRIGGHLQNFESLIETWDFPMTLLYRPDHVPSTAQGALDEADEWLNSHRVNETWRTMNRLRDTFVRELSR